MAFHRGIVGLLAGLLLHASLIAAMPLVWCVGPLGHNAIEICTGPTCHQSGTQGAGTTETSAVGGPMLAVDHPHEHPCVDHKVMDELFGSSHTQPPVVAPILVAVPAPLTIATSPARCAVGPAGWSHGAIPEPPQSRSLVLRI